MQEIKCRNYDCKRMLTSFEFERINRIKNPLQSKHNYCVKCRYGKCFINRILCHYCNNLMKHTSHSKYICDNCKKIRKKENTRKNYLKNRKSTKSADFVTKQKKLQALLMVGVYTRKELIEILDTTDKSLHQMLDKLGKKENLQRGYYIKK